MARVIKFLRGNKAQNEAYIGSLGTFTVDTELDCIRLHDGVTPGGIIIPNINMIRTLFLNDPNYTLNMDGGTLSQTQDTTYDSNVGANEPTPGSAIIYDGGSA